MGEKAAKPLFVGIEPLVHEHDGTGTDVSRNRYLHSIAISSKRIADALERLADQQELPSA